VIFMVIRIKNLQIRYGVLTYILATYIFYTLSATKMEFFCLIAAPLLIIALACLFDYLFHQAFDKFQKPVLKYLKGIVIAVCGMYFLQLSALDERHSSKNDFWRERSDYTIKYKKLILTIPDQKYTIVNCNYLDAHIIMFYSGMPAYGRMITDSEKQQIKKKGYKIYIINQGSLPEYLLSDLEIEKVSL
ncbi:MAG: hypothetical protein ACHQF2_08910, partial [Flavobacteriales bacterium]